MSLSKEGTEVEKEYQHLKSVYILQQKKGQFKLELIVRVILWVTLMKQSGFNCNGMPMRIPTYSSKSPQNNCNTFIVINGTHI